MKDFNNKIISGSPIRGEFFKLQRAKAIYKAAIVHPYVKDVQCYVNGNGDSVIKMCMTHLEIPDEPIFDIRDEEEIAIICHPVDISIPEVYALREDFPTELPHSNASPYAHPVSLCVSDVSFADIRPQFNAHDFLNSIRRWFALNSINQLHESNRPLEIFFWGQEDCCILNERTGGNPYIRYSKKTKFSSTIEFVEKSSATHYLIYIPTEKTHASNFVRIPKTMGDLKDVLSTDKNTLTDRLLAILTNSIAGKSTLPLFILIYITQSSKDDKDTSHELFLIKANCICNDIVLKKKTLHRNAFEKWYHEIPIEVVPLVHMTTLNDNAYYNGIKDSFNKVSVIGTGTLGSAVIDHWVRQGCSEEINLVDFDILLPHNLSRHTLTTDKVMSSKVRSIKASYQGIWFQKINAIEGNFLTLSQNDRERIYKNTELVMDFSTSIAVERKLANEECTPRRCTSFLNPKGDDVVLLIEDKDRNFRLDLLEMDYYRNLIVDERFALHLEQTE
ncbi:MAG: ThiF family adenylyltransferase, partial [Bacteroidaceae bacterium]|nr:ThiF family adenylyltransferase [Bacteroidaceae bacterium]